MSRHYRIVIVGGGSAGISVAARLAHKLGGGKDIALVEPSEKHYYQPLWTLVGAGVSDKASTVRPEAGLIPKGVTWIKDRVASFDPDHDRLSLASGEELSYDQLVVAAGIQIDWDGIKGLREAMGKGGVCSNYSFETVDSTWETLRNFEGGTAIFTTPNTPIKCGGAPQKIMYLAEDYMRNKSKVRDRARVIFATPGDGIFSVEKYKRTLEKVVARKGIEMALHHNLIEIRPETKEAVFQIIDSDRTETIPYAMLHVTPPMSAPDFIKQSPLANAEGWVEVDPHTLQHLRYPKVWSLGDCSSLPTSKTGAAVRKQAPTLVTNMFDVIEGRQPSKRYNGYTSCPVVTGYGSLVLAEFDYDMQPAETFPFDQAKERLSMYLMKKYLLPPLYWFGMLKGRA
ncbi:MAG: NAD(P)/FAD-dependent oxidoreductase [Chloroflexi bacterium]|nr:NAD(P)/FAD-dependent oxidoreductase [Chloroflexota bacterium]